jgi:preprotein translocase subunit SecA
MFKGILESFIGTKSERDLKKLHPIVVKINSLEPEFEKLSDDELKNKTAEFKARLEKGESLDDLLPETFAAVREASKRTTKMRHFDVQLLGGVILHQGKIAEMRTGEGKTLVATLSAYLNALPDKGVNIVTVNDYLAKRDSQWMGPIFEFLGFSVGFVSHDMKNEERRQMYNRDITYVTNNEIGFDYLRDNMVTHKSERVLRNKHYAIIDEVDSILVDEARTPLIISGPSEESTDKYYIVDRVIPSLKVRIITEKEEVRAKYSGEDLAKGYDAIIDEKAHTATLTDEGVAKSEKFLGVKNIYDDVQAEWVHHLTQALRAHHLYEKDDEYVVKDGEVIIVDEFTGRLMPGRRWSDGLHQAVEAKEKMRIKEENQTLATITFQNFFKLYSKLAGMTGTAMTEAGEFWEIYKLDVVEIPTNKPCIRLDSADVIYLTEKDKFNAITEEITECWKRGQPVLVGTRSIDKSEKLSGILRAKGIPHQVLNAKYHEMEAEIITQAGRKGGITIATNMAGRGTDIVLGGNPPSIDEQKHILAEGGLYVLGTERHESRRIDNQLRGRCARQGDPGASRFYVALDDELMRLFGSDRISAVMQRLGMKEGEAIESRLISRQIEGAQKRVEGHNFEIRKHLLDYDKVMNKQRTAVYHLRNAILDGEDESKRIMQMIEEVVEEKFEQWADPAKAAQLWDLGSIDAFLKRIFSIVFEYNSENFNKSTRDSVIAEILEKIKQVYAERVEYFKEQDVDFKEIERMLFLQFIDQSWKHHLYELDQLQKSVGLRAYGQKDPLIEYQKESFALYQNMLGRVRDQVVGYIFKIQLPPRRRTITRMEETRNIPGESKSEKGTQTVVKTKQKIGRNAPCPCGSGKKYKKCCGR